MKIQAAVLRQLGRPFSVETLELDEPRRGEVLLKMAAAGVCHSDWHLMTGDTKHRLPVVPGHEGAGVVLRVGEGVQGISPGDPVAINWSPACHECFYCDKGSPYLCTAYVECIWAGTQLDGTSRLSRGSETVYQFHAVACFADHMVVPQQCCVKMDRELPLTIAALIGCAVTTGVGAVLNTAKIEAGSQVAVFGAGGVGLSVIMGAKLAAAASVIAVDRSAQKCDTALNFGATTAILSDADPVERIRELTQGRGADYVFEAVGDPAVQEQCFEAARPGGMIVLAGLSPMGSATNFPGSQITRQAKTIVGSYYGSADVQLDFPRFAQLYREGKLDLDRLISRTYPLESINEAYADMLAGRVARGLIVFD